MSAHNLPALAFPSRRWKRLTEAEAQALQEQLRSYVRIEAYDLTRLHTVGGVDVAYPRGTGIARAAVVVCDYPSCRVVDKAVAQVEIPFPYRPGLLALREVPPILTALQKLNPLPDLLMVDGHGYAHPRRFGLACHLGVLLNLPTIGCAKSPLVGEYAMPEQTAGSSMPLVHNGEQVGAVLRTREAVKPIFVSVGHGVDLASALEVALTCCKGYRLPQPLRLAHHLAGKGHPAGAEDEG